MTMIAPNLQNIAADQAAHGDGVTASAAETRHQKLVAQTQKWVAMTFYGQLLKEMRQSPFRSKLFDGGSGGEAFGALYDQELASRMGGSATNKLVDAIVRQIEGNTAASRAYDRQIRNARSIQDSLKGTSYVSPDIRA